MAIAALTRLGEYFVGGAVLYPSPMDATKEKVGPGGEVTYAVPLLWDWKDRSAQTRTGVARVRIRFAETEGKK